MRRIYAVLMVVCLAGLGCAYYSKNAMSIQAESFERGLMGGIKVVNGNFLLYREMDTKGMSQNQCLNQDK